MKNFIFANNETQESSIYLFLAVISSGLNTQQQLFYELSHKLTFPTYFGLNLDALFDCLTDLSWIEQHDIIIVHKDIPELETVQLKAYLEVLNDAILDWKNDGLHSLHVIFPVTAEVYLSKIFATLC